MFILSFNLVPHVTNVITYWSFLSATLVMSFKLSYLHVNGYSDMAKFTVAVMQFLLAKIITLNDLGHLHPVKVTVQYGRVARE